MKKTIIASLAVLGCAAVVATLALGGGPKLNTIFEAKATDKNFTFDAATGSQFSNDPGINQVVDVTTGSSDPIHTVFGPRNIDSLAFGQNGRFLEAHPIAGASETSYSLKIGINNLTHFEIDVGVINDVVESLDGKDVYEIQLRDAKYHIVKDETSNFKLDGDGNGTVHIEWDKGDNASTVVWVLVNLYFAEDSVDTSLYVESMSLTWAC